MGRQIEKNRGLTRDRKKIDSNPRVKNREKFRKAVIRRKGQVRAVTGAGEGPWVGIDLENGMYYGGNVSTASNTPLAHAFVTAMVKGRIDSMALLGGDADAPPPAEEGTEPAAAASAGTEEEKVDALAFQTNTFQTFGGIWKMAHVVMCDKLLILPRECHVVCLCGNVSSWSRCLI